MSAAQLELSASFSDNARTRPILDGAVRVAGLRLYCTVLHPSEMFWRQLHFEEFDISEMSISSLLISATRGDFTWAAVPIFTMRKFFHTSVLVNAAAGIDRPQDLRGKRVGVPEYQQTWAVWSRGVLEDEFGVRPQDIHWFMERGADRSHGAATGFRPPPGVRVDPVPGEAKAAANVRPLFPDPLAEGRRYYAKTGLYPVNHVVVVRRSLLDRHPWIALNLLEAFSAAKDEARRRAEDALQPYVEAGEGPGLRAAGDAMAYGFKANRAVLEALSRYQAEQGLVEQPVDPATVFARSTLAT
jgi:4,5-dihydroxyphthalate decarboxylase